MIDHSDRTTLAATGEFVQVGIWTRPNYRALRVKKERYGQLAQEEYTRRQLREAKVAALSRSTRPDWQVEIGAIAVVECLLSDCERTADPKDSC